VAAATAVAGLGTIAVLAASDHAWRLGSVGLAVIGSLALARARVSAVRQARREAQAGAERSWRTLSIGGFEDALEAELDRAVVLDRGCVVAVLELDDRDDLTERLGRRLVDEMGSRLLASTRTHTRAIDTVASLGGGAVAVAVPDVERHLIEPTIVGLHESVAKDLLRDAVTISIGYATGPGAGTEHARDLLEAGERALFAARHEGGDRVFGWGREAERIVLASRGERRKQRDAQLDAMLALAEALDLRDADTAQHSKAVGRYAEIMARALGLPLDVSERIRIAGILHDIGKIGVPDSVLRKPAKLDDDEWAQMQQHPEIGGRILASLDVDDIRSWIVAHHERPDGRGYPLGLDAEQIPLAAKILAVADAYEAMTADRVYRAAPGPEFAREELLRCCGSQFDADVVDAFLDALDTLGEGVPRDDAPEDWEVAA
jgi:putative nucleotidyltransferase with HDIG domain